MGELSERNIPLSFVECKNSMEAFQTLREQIGVPLSPTKIKGPYQTITYLGIEIDSTNMVIRLPREKLDKLIAQLKKWKVGKEMH